MEGRPDGSQIGRDFRIGDGIAELAWIEGLRVDSQDGMKPIEIGQVLRETFGLISERAATVFGIALIITVPSRLLMLLLATQGVLLPGPDGSFMNFGFSLFGMGVFDTIAMVFGQGALIGAALARREGRQLGLFQTLAPAVRQLPILLPVSLIYLFGFVAGIALLIVPGFILATMWSVPGPVLVAENTGMIQTFRRNQDLTRNTLRRIFLLMLVAGIGTSLFKWLLGRLGLLLFDSSSSALAFAVEPAPFLFESLLVTLVSGFNLALVCTLYIALIERHGDGPMTDRLAHIFA